MLDGHLNGWSEPKEPAFASSTVWWKSPPLQQSHPLHVLSGSSHRSASALKHILWSCFRPESGKRLVWVAWLCSAVSFSYRPRVTIAHVSALSWPILQTACFSASSQGFWNLSYNPWLLVGGFRIIFFFTAFQIFQRSCWNSWLASRSGIKMSWNIHILHSLLLLLDRQIVACLSSYFPAETLEMQEKGWARTSVWEEQGTEVFTQLLTVTNVVGRCTVCICLR